MNQKKNNVTVYNLSNTQAKEISRGNLVRVCIPHPEQDLDDAREYALQRLNVPPKYVRRVYADIVRVNPMSGKQPGIGGVYGMIERKITDAWPQLGIEVIVCELAERAKPRSRYPVQWPGSATLPDGRIIPEVKS